MHSKSLKIVLSSVQLLILTVLAPTYALPTGEPLLKRATVPPSGDYSTQWQQYFQVTNPLPGINFTLGNNYAGNIAVQRPQYPDDSLFFWGFEQSPGSLTAPANQSNNKPWAIWLQGGPGYSSMFSVFSENGPIHLQPNSHLLSQNGNAWNNLIDYIWVDQPVGVGYSVANASGYAADEDQVGADFVGFLANLVKVFPSLATRPFYLTGESYAGRYIPYIAKAIFSSPKPPVNLAKLAVGDPAFGKVNEFKTMPTLRLIETYPQLIAYDTDVFDYFKQQTHLCKLDLNLTYPQTGGRFPSIRPLVGAKPGLTNNNNSPSISNSTVQGAPTDLRKREEHHAVWKRATLDTPNNTINSWYGCYLWDEMVDYAINFTYPFNLSQTYNAFNVPSALSPRPSRNPSFFMNDPTVKAALHAPAQTWLEFIDYPWGSVPGRNDPSPEPMVFFDQLAANASARGVKIITYVGNDDGISPHFGTEVIIQNTTFGGIQGFTRQPSTPWYDDYGQWAGVVHQERNWTYALVTSAGHEVPGDRPPAAYTFLREFIIGNNPTGAVVQSGSSVTVTGGENPTLKQSAITGQRAIAYGAKTTQGVYAYPTATIQAFENYVGLVPITGTNAVAPTAAARR